MTSYAAQKGRAVQALRSTPAAAPKVLSQADEDRVAANKHFVQQHLGEMIPFFKDLHAEGMLDGWRSVQNCKLNERK